MKIAVVGGIKNIKELGRLFREDVDILFFIDNNIQLNGKQIDGKMIYSPYNYPKDCIDYIVVLLYGYGKVNQELKDLGVCAEHIINLMDFSVNLLELENVFNLDVANEIRLERRMQNIAQRVNIITENQKYFEQNYLYEAIDRLNGKKLEIPKVKSVEDTCSRIIADKCSMSRYGDGEFEIIFGNAKDVYQNNDVRLAERLKNILISNLQNHIVAIADDYGAMEGLREENKNVIRRYMTTEKREKHYALLDMKKEYYNAYISRPYVIYPHNELENARKRFDDLKQIWDKQKILFIEGDKTRMGISNDLFVNAEGIERIIAPNENAFDVYDEIYNAALKYGREKLILIALGPTATVLAYDLAKAGYWALDIGHLDLEYEWFLKGEGYSYIPHKYNNEVWGDTNVIEIDCPSYGDSILCRVGI